ncbi:MAG: fluoride efflux transporter CrcB [Deltaproteobacteria bacterium]|nr:fluoride efflux transporter CrcB [Deltaproteobacteria bacterium]
MAARQRNLPAIICRKRAILQGMQTVLISLAGIFGVLGRYFMSLGVTRLAGPGFPFATVLINVLGSFLIGVVYVLGAEKAAISETTRVALMVGFMGGFTTFSSFALETVRLFEGGQLGLAVVNVLVSVVLCLGAVAFGLFLARAV